jgi:diguanylate cyclase (GGDEF)-like protein/PAS domain S-box-containing protein
LIDSLKQRVDTKEKNEFGKLYAEVNTMLERMESSQQAQKIAATAFETQSGMTITDADQNILQINKAFTDITGYTSEEAIGEKPSLLNSGYHDDTFYKNMYESLIEYQYWSGEIYNLHKDGTVYPEHLTIQAVLDNNENVIYYVASFLDLTFQKEVEAKVEYLKQYDSLTGLPNKELLIQTIQQHLDEERQEGWGALLCVDIQDFKIINDAYGHINGDILLKQITERLKDNFKSSDMIGRIGGDEFTIWINFLDNNKEKASIECETLAQYLIMLLTQPFTLDDKTIHPIPCVGIALYNMNEKDANILLKQADGALHLAKKKKDSNLAFFDKQTEEMLLTHLELHAQLSLAVEKEQLELFYQLQYDQNHQVYGAEALIRWNHPSKGLISPI